MNYIKGVDGKMKKTLSVIFTVLWVLLGIAIIVVGIITRNDLKMHWPMTWITYGYIFGCSLIHFIGWIKKKKKDQIENEDTES